MKIPVVDKEDKIIDYKERDDRNFNDIIRITAIWITDENDNILLQQRKLNKKINPGKWGPSVSGTVEEGETYESNAHKEVEEEIGIKEIELVESNKFFREPISGKKFVQLFLGKISKNSKLIPQESEVELLKWFSEKELLDYFDKKPEDFVDFMKDLITFLKIK